MGRLSLLVPVVLSLLSASASATGTCFYPDGKTSVPGHVPCNQTTSAASACCDPLDSCSSSGFCLGRSGWIYRGSCTDQAWESANCPKQIEQCVNNPDTNKPMNFFAAVWSCSQPGFKSQEFCCGYSEASCCNSSFTLPGGTGVAFKPGVDAFVQSISQAAVASATGSSTATAAATHEPSPSATDANCSNSNGDLGTKVGVGVGVPLGVLAIGILTFLFWRESRKRNAGSVPAQEHSMAHNGMGGAQAGAIGNGSYAPVATHTPDNTYSPAPVKLNPWSPTPTYEAPANSFSPQELSNSPNGGR